MNPVILPEDGPSRGLIAAGGERSPEFLARYERKVLFYDVFWHADGKRIVVHGPPPVDLGEHYRAMTFIARPSGKVLRARAHHSRLVHLYALPAPQGTTHLDIVFAGKTLTVPVGPSHAADFAGQNLLFTLSKDNDLRWIADWAHYHVVHQQVTAVLLFDNGSTRYSLADLEQTLAGVPGLRKVGVVPVPFSYPREDRAVPANIFWAHFLQPSVIVNMFRRYGAAARGILNCDIDELAVPLAGETVFDTASASRSGTVYFRDAWIEPVPTHPRAGGYRHADFREVVKGTDFTRGSTAKWAVAPDRRWLRNLKVHPYPHAFENRPQFTRHKPGTAFIAHFKAISTGWKYDRSVAAEAGQALEVQPALAATLRRAFGDGD